MLSHEHVDSLADDELLRNVVQGCTDCFALLFHRYCRQVFSVSFRIIRDKAETEDILQEVFLSIFLQQERYDPSRGSVRTWILQFAYFKSLLRRRYLRIRHFYNYEEVSEAREMRGSESHELRGMSSGLAGPHLAVNMSDFSFHANRAEHSHSEENPDKCL
jgi:DNA-directed RNA polymerase specialized sigma24 family protein